MIINEKYDTFMNSFVEMTGIIIMGYRDFDCQSEMLLIRWFCFFGG